MGSEICLNLHDIRPTITLKHKWEEWKILILVDTPTKSLIGELSKVYLWIPYRLTFKYDSMSPPLFCAEKIYKNIS